jgi:CDP-glycerol glycerophosphotransferase (TagB/SpsB family)
MKGLYYSLINILNLLLPKFKYQVAIITFPDFDDQSRVLSKDLVGYEVYVLVEDAAFIPAYMPQNIKVVPRRTLRGICVLLTSRCILLTHGLDERFRLLRKSRQVVINVTHGMYFKKMHKLLGSDIPTPQFHFVLSTSPLFSPMLCEMFALSKSSIVMSNLPRTNILLSRESSQYFINLRKRFRKIHLWMPTYRKSKISIDIDTDSLVGDWSFNWEKLNQMMRCKGELLIIKPHPSAIFKFDSSDYSNINVMTNEDLLLRGFSLYAFMAHIDILWTDYSSVFVDFMVTRRPIIFLMLDRRIYEKNRGLTINLDKLDFPGPIIETFSELIDSLSSDTYEKHYSIQPFLSSCQRVETTKIFRNMMEGN